jgi:uncharacterized protein (DUF1015 family)
VSVPVVRPFRALRYRRDAVADLGAVVSPPYDVISPDLQRRLLARDPRNVVRLDLPEAHPGEQPDERYRRAARTLAAWRSDGTLHKDPRLALYAYEQSYVVPGTTTERVQRGFFGRLRLEPFGAASGVLPHERTLSAPKEDRYRLLRATGVNTSPVVGLYPDPGGVASRILTDVARTAPESEVEDDDGVIHRVWVVPDDGAPDGLAAQLAETASRGPITLADGHHRYETALRHRNERRMSRSCEEDPAFDYLLMLFLSTGESLTVLPTHRVICGLDEGALVDRAGDLFDVQRAGREDLQTRFAPVVGGGRGRFGLWTRNGGAILDARPEAFGALLPNGGDAVRSLDVTLLGVALDRLLGIDEGEVTSGDRVAYTKSASEAMDWVERRDGGADAAFLLEPTPVDAVIAVAAEGDVMPQKSTYFYPKPLTGLVINPHEW